MSYVIGIDPPRGWGAWGSPGVLAWGQTSGSDHVQMRERLFAEVLHLFEVTGRGPLAILIEHAHGRLYDDPFSGVMKGQIRELLKQADSAGWLHGKLDEHCDIIDRPLPNVWRSSIGINVTNRGKAKELAVRFATKAALETTGERVLGPRGGELEHACEGLCMAIAAWKAHGPWEKDPLDAYNRWRREGTFGDGKQGGSNGTQEGNRG